MNKLSRRIFGGKKKDENRVGKKLHGEKLNSSYPFSPTQSGSLLTKLKWAGYVVRMGEPTFKI